MVNNQIGIQGETIPLYFNYKLDGVNLEEATNIGNIEFQLLQEGASGALKLTKSGGRIVIDEDTGKYKALLSQEETFALPQTVKWQIKVLDTDNNAIADDIGTFTLGKALAKTALQ